MKKLLIILAFVPLVQNLFGQKEFAPIGATWYYTIIENMVPDIGYKKVVSERDTLVNGKACKILSNIVYSAYNNQTYSKYNYIIHQKGDSIYYWQNNDFRLIYDFSLEKNDTMNIYSDDFLCLNNQTHWGSVIVDSVTYTTINGFKLKTIHTSPTSNSIYLYIAPFVEIIGSLSYIFPTDTGCGAMDIRTEFTELRCYSDSIIGDVYFNNSPCDSTYAAAIPARSKKNEALILYNFNCKSIEITLNSMIEPNSKLIAFIYDMNGRKLQQKELFNRQSQLSVSGYKNGIYIVQIIKNNKIIHNEKIYKY